MKEGLLWFNTDHLPLEVALAQAVERYTLKHKEAPNHCIVHPSMLEGRAKEWFGEVLVTTSNTILHHHLWVGVERNIKSE